MVATVYSPQGEIEPALMTALRLHIDWEIEVVGEPIDLSERSLAWLRVARMQQQIANVVRHARPDIIILTITDGDWIQLLPWMQNFCGDKIPILITETTLHGGYCLNRFKRLEQRVCVEPFLKRRKIRLIK